MVTFLILPSFCTYQLRFLDKEISLINKRTDLQKKNTKINYKGYATTNVSRSSDIFWTLIIFCIPFLDFWFEKNMTVAVAKVMAVDLIRCEQIQNAFSNVRTCSWSGRVEGRSSQG